MNISMEQTVFEVTGSMSPMADSLKLTQTLRPKENSAGIKEILFCGADTFITEATSRDGLCCIKGNANCTMYYRAENDVLDAITAEIPYEYIGECPKGLLTPLINARITSAKAVNVKPRRADMEITVAFEGLLAERAEASRDLNLKDIDMLYIKSTSQSADTISINQTTEKIFLEFETTRSPQNAIACTAELTTFESARGKGGLLFSASLTANALYTCQNDDNDSEYYSALKQVDIERFIELPDNAFYDSYSITAKVCAGPSEVIWQQEGALLTASADLAVTVIMYKKNTWDACEDLYSAQRAVLPVIKQVKCARLTQEQTIPLSLNDAKKTPGDFVFVKGSFGQMRYDIKQAEEICEITGEVEVTGILFKEQGEAFRMERLVLPFKETLPKQSGEQLFITPELKNFSMEIDDDKLIAAAETHINFSRFAFGEIPFIEEVNEGAFEAENDSYQRITVVYATDKEDLWEAAKEAGRGIAEILADNSINDIEDISGGKPLIIR
ncbi:MAG: hypothetical protein GX061_06740 [Eubacteriaceae bacterium]|nr:hypothetical protein [Eubacteriaceae bacterium]